jgi:hypothetical protein
MSATNLKLDAGLLGAAGAALWWWNQDAQNQDNQLRVIAQDTQDANSRIGALVRSSDWIRMQAPTVRDAIIGVAAATPAAQPPATVPTIISSVSRPDLSSGANIPSLSWPPAPGVYDSLGRTNRVGQLGLAFSVLTYQEPTAFLQGLTQERPPTPDEAMALFLAAQAFAQAVMAKNLTQAQWQVFWSTLINGGTPASSLTAPDVHADSSRPPSATPQTAAAVMPLNGTTVPGYPYSNPNTDAVSRWRITTNPAGNSNGDVLFHVAFAREFRTLNNAPFQPAIMIDKAYQMRPANVTSTGFDVVALCSFGPNSTVDIMVATVAGVPTLQS